MECFSAPTIHERLSTYSATILGLLDARPLHQLPVPRVANVSLHCKCRLFSP